MGIGLAEWVVANLAFTPGERVLMVESDVDMMFRGGIVDFPMGPSEISTKIEGWTIKSGGVLILTNKRIIYAVKGRKYLLLKTPKILFESPISTIYSVGVARGHVSELVVSLETQIWRKDKFYFRVKDPNDWAKNIEELISLHRNKRGGP
ncbi:MAG TPA: hypothetical protein EYP68_00785 [Candidatus Korarchaeota archaeon]|nr:hypothetical protein [Candidatus Korarchaeota archaeon]